MHDQTPPSASSSNPLTAFKLGVAALFVTLSAAAFLSQPGTNAATASRQAKEKNPLPATEKNLALGLDHFDAYCATCHGTTGKADTEKGRKVGATDLTSDEVRSMSDGELFRTISRGVPGTAMPAFAKTHKPAEIWQTILFLRKLPTLTPEERKKLESAVPASARQKHGSEHHHDEEQNQEHKHEQPGEGGMSSAQAQPQHQHDAQPSTLMAATAKAPSQQKTPADEHAGHQLPAATVQQRTAPGPEMTLAELERIASQNNPTLAQADAAIRAAQGRRKQAGLFPNPVVGYQGEEFAFRAFSEKSEHFFFVEQTIPLGGKLSKSQRIFEKEVSQAGAEAAAQKQRVLNTVRMLYYEALGAQQRVDLRSELARIAREAVKITSELQNVGQADRPDYLESEIEAQQVELEHVNSENDLDQIWRLLASVVGMPEMKPMRLAGDLEAAIPALDQETLMATLLQESPEIKSARAEVERAQAVLARAKAERVPDLFLRGGIGYSNEILETRTGPAGRKTGTEANVQIGFNLPIFNRNQGGIAAAEAGVTIAEREMQRLELSLRARLAQVFRDYNNALSAIQRYQQTILPRAERAYNLYLSSFRQMAASYPQVLISQRTTFQVRENYLNALVNLRQSAIRLEGFLLTGGLDAPRIRSSETGGERVEMTGVRSASQGSPDGARNH